MPNLEKFGEPLPDSVEKKLQSERAEESANEIQMVKKITGEIFDSYKEGPERIKDILFKIKPFLEFNLIDGNKIREALEKCSTIEDKDKFIEKVLSSLEPILDLKNNNPQAFEKIQREALVERGGGRVKKINEILLYSEAPEGIIHIHLAPAKELAKEQGIGGVKKLVIEGLEKLAEIVEKNEGIKEIRATSWIVAKIPQLIEKLGFTVMGEIDEEIRKKYFANDERKISTAIITREEFLKKYF